jgi:hypothetical protein
MSGKDRILCLLVCAVFGLIGGALVNLGFLSVEHAKAQSYSSVSKAQRFVVVDDKGNDIAEFGNKNGRAELNLNGSTARSTLSGDYLYFYDSSGVPRLSLGVFRPADPRKESIYSALTIWDGKGRQTYEAR